MKKKKGGKYAAPGKWTTGGFIGGLIVLLVCMTSICATGLLLKTLLLVDGDPGSVRSGTAEYAIMDSYDMQLTNTLSSALEGVLSIEKIYWLNDREQVAPEPNQENYGSTDDPSTLGWLLEEASGLLDGEKLSFSTETEIAPGTQVEYYYDETILVITWKEVIDWITYSFSEVKIAHPSQFRRFLAGGEYGSSVQLTTTEMAASVNAVVASSGDFYKFRSSGIIVYEGVVQKMSGKNFDTCFIDENGDLQFVYAGEITKMAEAQQYVDENKIRFSLGFGPVMVDEGQLADINPSYSLGEISSKYARAGLGQIGKLHYLLVTANSEFYPDIPNVFEFAQIGLRMNCQKFYNLDGGQTAVLCMNDKLVNAVVYGSQRRISDIIYFATAIPNGG